MIKCLNLHFVGIGKIQLGLMIGKMDLIGLSYGFNVKNRDQVLNSVNAILQKLAY